jgi:curli biogenesis system outer membrane secretion channel CsgG
MNKKSVIFSLVSLLVLTSMLLSSCGAPATTEAPATAAPSAEVPTESPATALPNCGTDPIEMKVVSSPRRRCFSRVTTHPT